MLRQLGGYTAIIDNAVQNRLARLKTNPRLSDERRQRLARDLRNQVAEARVRVQTYLSRSTFVSGGPSSPTAETVNYNATGRLSERRSATFGTYAETLLASEDLRLLGRVDLLTVGEHGAEITDYKTGSEDPSHREQLEVYALLWNLDRSVNPGKRPVARLTAAYPSHDVTIPVPDESVMQELETMLITRIAAADAALAAAPPRAIPNNENCGYCQVRHLCADYWSTMIPDPATLPDGAWFDCQGTVGAQNGARSWWLHLESTGQPNLLLKMPPTGPELITGSSIRVLGLRIDKDPDVEATVSIDNLLHRGLLPKRCRNLMTSISSSSSACSHGRLLMRKISTAAGRPDRGRSCSAAIPPA